VRFISPCVLLVVDFDSESREDAEDVDSSVDDCDDEVILTAVVFIIDSLVLNDCSCSCTYGK
jgi:hypothetical protein